MAEGRKLQMSNFAFFKPAAMGVEELATIKEGSQIRVGFTTIEKDRACQSRRTRLTAEIGMPSRFS